MRVDLWNVSIKCPRTDILPKYDKLANGRAGHMLRSIHYTY